MKIALTYTGNEVKHNYYVDWLMQKDNIDVIKLSVLDNNLNELKNCDALVLSGGVDIHPGIYNNEILNYANAPVNGFQKDRDQFEIACFHLAIEKQIPVLGICRGMQLINVIHGGTMIQDLNDDTLNKIHRNDLDKYHTVNIINNTLLHSITGETFGEVNSAHHQSIDVSGAGLMVNCKANDSTIEGIEWKEKEGKPFMLAIQWHPERMFKLPESPLSKNIRDAFIATIKNSITKNKSIIIDQHFVDPV